MKNNHGEWVDMAEPDLGPGISERVRDALRTTDENIGFCHSMKSELREALTLLLGVLSHSLSSLLDDRIEKNFPFIFHLFALT